MPEYINTEKIVAQYNGPVNSSDFNKVIEQNYQDLVQLYNRSGILSEDLRVAFERVLKDHLFMVQALTDLEDRVKSLESEETGKKFISLYNYSQLDPASFVNSQFAIPASEILTLDYINNTLTLPKIMSSSYSKIKFFNNFIGQVIPDFFEAKVDNSLMGADSPNVLIDTSPVYNAILDSSDKFWKRNVILDAPSPMGAQMYLYIKIPTAYGGSDKTNFLSLNPYPVFGVDVLTIEYTTKPNPSLTNADGWAPLNYNKLYDGDPTAVGSVPPGAWTTVGSDKILNSGPVGFYFQPLPITAVRVLLRQRNYIVENNKYVYTYGLSDLDIRFDKFLPSGRTMVKFDAPVGTLIYDIVNVTPKIYNVPEELVSSVFSYRVIYLDSGVYTEENPGSSNSVWIEVTLTELGDGTPPVLSDIIIEYT